MSHRHFKERQSRRLNWIIQQELAEQRLREEQEQADAQLSNQLRTLSPIKPNDSVQEVYR